MKPKSEVKLFNTLSGEKELLPKHSRGKPLRLFVCGPTVYDYAHIGHARTYVFFDFLVRYLRSQKRKAFYLQNITNVDDKIIARAKEEKKDPLKLAEFFTKEYKKDMKAIGVTSVDAYAPATKFIPEILKQIQTLIKKGYAYKIENDGYYFDISKFRDYGKLSGRTALRAEDAISRIDESIKKRNKGDFCLWKFSKKGEPSWKTPLGNGRPGWHIEDTAISEKYFGPQYDIHGGGVDLKFPHHEAEIAQQEAASEKKPFVKIWIHTGVLTINGKKMSKSLGNFITIRDFLKKNDLEVLRLMIFQHHYRSPMDYNEKLLEDAKNTWNHIKLFVAKLDFLIKYRNANHGGVPDSFYIPFYGELSDDINTPIALNLLIFGAINHYNMNLNIMDYASLVEARNLLKKSLSLFGILPPPPKMPLKIKRLFKKREACRDNKQFAQSDRLRKKIEQLGYVIEDTEYGSFISPR